MKDWLRVRLIVFVGTVLLLGSGCAANMYPGGPSPAGILYTNTITPAQNLTVATDKDAKSLKRGEASATAILGMFAFGDAGIDAAMKAGGITKVHHIDHSVKLFIYGIFLQDKTIVYGE